MLKQISRRIAVVLAMVMLLTCVAYTVPVNAASKADMKKANVKWDLKNNKTLKFKTTWSVLGVKKHTVKMTKFKVKNAKKKGYKQCSFRLTVKRNIAPTDSQLNEMLKTSYVLDECKASDSDNAPFGGEFYYAVVDYKTGKSLIPKNKKKVTVKTSGWKYSSYDEKRLPDTRGMYYPKKSTIDVTITYPKNYKNLAIGFGGFTAAPAIWTKTSSGGSGGVGWASASGGVTVLDLSDYWNGRKAFSKETNLYSKKDKGFAHFMRVK